ncbi:MAG: transglutaminase family protein [Solirubrobacterales bacterium]|nr:transglutaminase family protein [Solirubrobacterales bacterium]
MDIHLDTTAILDYRDAAIERLVADRGWRELPESDRIGAVYDFVRDEVRFGYNESDRLSASRVLADGYGQCNTKTTLLMALLRAVGIPCRFHGATIHKRLQKGVVDGFFYRLAPDDIIHSWTEVRFEERWVGLEGVILDDLYLEGIRNTVATDGGEFLGYGVGTDNIDDPPIRWCGTDTAIQTTGVNRDFGVYDDPDTFYAEHGGDITGVKGVVFRHLARHLMNRKVAEIRSCGAS